MHAPVLNTVAYIAGLDAPVVDTVKKFADLAAGRPLASSATHKRRRKDLDAVHDALLQALMDGVGSTHDKLMGLEAIDSKSGLF